MTQPVWTPSKERIERSNLKRFMRFVNDRYQSGFDDYASLYDWSSKRPTEFWESLWDFADVRAARRWDTVLEHPDRMPGAKWFGGSRLNFAENLLRYRDSNPAIVFVDEGGRRNAMSYAQLYAAVAGAAGALRAAGVGKGDRVVGFMPNRPEAIIAMLATTAIGAVWSSCSPDFGIHGVLDRFGQISPSVLITADGYFYAGKTIDSLTPISDVLKQLPSVQRVVVVPYVDESPDIAAIPNAILWPHFIADGGERLEFEALPFDHPLYIMYSSGTTGVPKCIVHGAGGTLLQHLKEHLLHTDLRREDRIFYFTTCGWMMWNWLASGLATGATVVLYEGSPFHPDPAVLWRMAEAERVSVFGTSAKYLAALEKAGVKPASEFDLTALRAVLSTGSPLAPESYDYVYRHVKADLQLSSISGGTDIISCFTLGNPILPVYRGELQCRGLGMSVEVFDHEGHSVTNEKGELVCTRPFPCMPIEFWNDPDGSRYHGAYFERFDNIWCHGDFAELTDRETLIIHGRSDAVLNPGGVRIGTAEIYRQVEKLYEVVESIAVGQDWQNDVRVVLFVKLRDDIALTDELQGNIRKVIRANTTPRHVPAKILSVEDIPRTISGKIVELAVRNVIHGQPVLNTDALANPQALEHFRDREELTTD